MVGHVEESLVNVIHKLPLLVAHRESILQFQIEPLLCIEVDELQHDMLALSRFNAVKVMSPWESQWQYVKGIWI